MDYLLTFHTQLDAVIARKTLTIKKIKVKLSPVPRSLSSSCGTCAKVFNVTKDDLLNVDMEELFEIDGDEYIKELI
jgi:hypothetical protein